MAVKKVKTELAQEVEVQVTDVEETEVNAEKTPETGAETKVEEETGSKQEVEISENTPEVQVDKEAKVDTSKKPEDRVKIRMRTDHKCCIAMERYDLKEGKTYVVPANVKNILNKAGLLAPL